MENQPQAGRSKAAARAAMKSNNKAQREARRVVPELRPGRGDTYFFKAVLPPTDKTIPELPARTPDPILCVAVVFGEKDRVRTLTNRLVQAAASSTDRRFDMRFMPFSRRPSETDEDYRERLARLLKCDAEVGDLDDDASNGRPGDGLSPTSTAANIQVAIFTQDVFCQRPEINSVINLVTEVKRLRPLVHSVMLTMSGLTENDIQEVGEQPITVQQLLETKILRSLSDRYDAPFWDAARKFADRPIISCHAMPLARGRSVINSPAAADFVEFYGDQPFAIETSAASNPLDSPHHPTGALKRAQAATARAFGADQSWFITNGTSTSNKMVLQALLAPGDLVLQDRRAHISHHHGLTSADARVCYLDSTGVDELGIPGGLSPTVLAASLDKIIRYSKDGLLPKVISLTNCTTDGVMVRPRKWFEAVRSTLARHGLERRFGEIIFLIDEAWFAFARFHPRLVEFTALHTASMLSAEDPFYAKNLRIYVTQSTHKTLTAFRQGSMLHCRDPYLQGQQHRDEAAAIERGLDQAYHFHVTTSVSVPMLASLDVGRRQAELEGCPMVENVLRLAAKFRQAVEDSENGVSMSYPGLGRVFGIVSPHELIRPEDQMDFGLDPTKITVRIKQGLTGGELKKWLLDKFDIHFNKNTHNTILLMLTIGFSDADLTSLLDRLERYASSVKESVIPFASPVGTIPEFQGFAQRHTLAPIRASEAMTQCQFHEPGFFSHGARSRSVLRISLREAIRLAESGCPTVAADYVTPYPPGFPLLIPGQLIDPKTARCILTTLLSTREIHGALIVDNDVLVHVVGEQLPSLTLPRSASSDAASPPL